MDSTSLFAFSNASITPQWYTSPSIVNALMDNTDSHCLLQAWTPLTIKTNHYTSVGIYWKVKIQEMEISPWIKFLTRINPVSIRSVDTCTSMDKNYSVKCGFFKRKQEFTAWISQKIKTYIYICPLIEFNTFQNLTSSGSMFQSTEMYCKYHKKKNQPQNLKIHGYL